jgi:hypothetical protein
MMEHAVRTANEAASTAIYKGFFIVISVISVCTATIDFFARPPRLWILLELKP